MSREFGFIFKDFCYVNTIYCINFLNLYTIKKEKKKKYYPESSDCQTKRTEHRYIVEEYRIRYVTLESTLKSTPTALNVKRGYSIFPVDHNKN